MRIAGSMQQLASSQQPTRPAPALDPMLMSLWRFALATTMCCCQIVLPAAVATDNNNMAAAAAAAVTVGVRMPASQAQEIERKFWAVSDTSSSEYQQYLSRQQLRQLRAADPAEAAEVRDWLRGMGCGSVRMTEARDAAHAVCPVRPQPMPGTRVEKLIDYVHVHGGASTANLSPRQQRHSTVVGTSNGQLPAVEPGSQQQRRPNFGTPVRQRQFYSLPESVHGTNNTNMQMVWGCGSFGVNKTELGIFYDKYCLDCDLAAVSFDTSHHGIEPGDNFGEGTLDTTYISSFGKGIRTVVSNTNISMSTEEGEAQGAATVFFMETLADRPASKIPLVLSLSLGSLSFGACDRLCSELAATSTHTYQDCHQYMQKQRQVCLYASYRQQERINTAFKLLGLRGTTVLGASGDGKRQQPQKLKQGEWWGGRDTGHLGQWRREGVLAAIFLSMSRTAPCPAAAANTRGRVRGLVRGLQEGLTGALVLSTAPIPSVLR
eukprot:COSAG01_NODE_297_length_19258_cov_8.905110_12_plen_491_part_00